MKRDEKKKVIKKFAVHDKDTGSSVVQVAVLTKRIEELQAHLEEHPNDAHSRKGLLSMVGKRRRHLKYLQMHKPEEYQKVLGDLKLRK